MQIAHSSPRQEALYLILLQILLIVYACFYDAIYTNFNIDWQHRSNQKNPHFGLMISHILILFSFAVKKINLSICNKTGTV